jgi:uncharacterized membrane protein YfcA
MTALPGNEIFTLAIALILAGGLTGFLAGLFGVGGGAILVPILYQVFVVVGVPDDLRMPLTVGTSLAVIIPTAVTSYLAHRKKGAVDQLALRLWSRPCVIGVVGGSALAAFAPAALFKIVFATVSAAIGIALLIGRQRWRVMDDLPRPLPMRIIGFVIGILSALMGISGGMLTNMSMLMLGLDPSGRRNVCRSRCVHCHPWSDWVRAGWLDANRCVATILPRLCLCARYDLAFGPRHVDCSVRRAAGPRNAASPAGIGLFRLPLDDVRTVCIGASLVIPAEPD